MAAHHSCSSASCASSTSRHGKGIATAAGAAAATPPAPKGSACTAAAAGGGGCRGGCPISAARRLPTACARAACAMGTQTSAGMAFTVGCSCSTVGCIVLMREWPHPEIGIIIQQAVEAVPGLSSCTFGKTHSQGT